MAKSNTFDLLTGIPSALFALKTTASSVVTPQPHGRVAISGMLGISLLGTSFEVRVPDSDPVIAGAAEPGGGRRLDFCPPISVKADVVGAGEGPGIVVRKWTFGKAIGKATSVVFDRFSVWSCKQTNVPKYPGSFLFELLLPGIGVNDAQVQSTPSPKPVGESGGGPAYAGWLQSWTPGGGRLVEDDEGWMVEHSCKLYPLMSSGLEQAGITFAATRGNNYQPLTFFVNYMKLDVTRVRLHFTPKGVPSTLDLDAPQAPVSMALLCLMPPPKYPLKLTSPQSQGGNLPVEKVRIELGRLRAFLHRDARNDIEFGTCATWSVPGSRIEVTAELPKTGHDTSLVKSVTFGSNPQPPASIHDDPRFDGLRIPGVDSTGRPKEVLDAQDLQATVLLKAGALANPKAPLVGLACGWLGPREGQRSQDARHGVLHMPIGQALLEVDRSGRGSPFIYNLTAVAGAKQDVWEGKLTSASASLRVPPFGGAASFLQTKDADAFSRSVRMRLRAKAILEANQSTVAPRMQVQPDWQKLWELDGPQGLTLHDMANLGTGFDAVSFKKLPPPSAAQGQAKAAEGNETLAYATLGLVLTYIAGAYEGQGWKKFFDRELKLNLDETALGKWAERNHLEDVVVSLGNLQGDGTQRNWFRNFVRDNVKQHMKTGDTATGALWPFAAGLGIPLYEGADPATATWLWDMKRNGKPLACAFAFDYSRAATFSPAALNLGAGFFKDSAAKDPALWPRTRAQHSGQLLGAVEDPGSNLWSGIFIADVPLVLPEVPQGFEFFRRLGDAINADLRLEYGWLDANGHTWSALWKNDMGAVRLYPFDSSQRPPVELLLSAYRTTGSQGQAATSALTLRLVLHSVIGKRTGKPVELLGEGQFGAVSGQQSIFELKPRDGSTIDTDSLPGFEKFSFKRFRTDFRSATLEVGLVAGQTLRDAIPFFDQTEIDAVMSIPLDSGGAPNLALRLPAEAPSRMFGKWPIGIRAVEFVLANAIRSRIHFALDTGIPGIKRTGGQVDVMVKGNDVGFDVSLEEVEIDLKAFGVGITGALAWRDPTQGIGGGTHASGEDLPDAVRRDFYGSVRVSGLSNSGEAGIYIRIGSQGRPFWVGALMMGKDPSVAGTKLQDSVFLIAYGAQQSAGDALRLALASPESVLPRSLFPVRGENPLAWLNTWQRATDGLGLAVGLTGQFSPDRYLATAPGGNDNLSALWSDSGLFYASARIKLLAAFETDFHLLIDFAKKLVSAGLQLPGLKVGGGVEVTAGYFSVTLAWGDKQGIGFSLGYPPIYTDPDLGIPTPDWSRAVSARISGAWPINTFQGGFKAWYFTNPVSFGLGFAVRVGYSNSWQVTGSNIADARADVGVMVGGTFMFCRKQVAMVDVPVLRLTDPTGADADRGWLLDAIEVFVDVSQDVMPVSASIFADVWGHASIVFLGVTIAGVRIDARAAFNVNGELEQGILYMGASFDFRVSVKIGCSSYSTSCHFSIVMINRGSGPAGDCNRLQAGLIDRLLAAEAEVI
ncbi:hypothetical protein EJP69_14985 [Variovorax gossypii]|uniref:Uncharacterized protein n=1 Tax=Variovorax gossypii TaxID=1679495 RepID=A0A431TK55_9BURK|nr:hypothetical protein [Variovorax gossypii]RTQ33677.1 hypothetical protein EJP69_14985 [Variovorax gossypii]